ncbi:MAG TPA: hypothetical protein DCQ98_12925, partial [Planctomycetaceae bacterium]|nr:hypothetical protein [Planctomycetaceae bacterium]
MLRRATNAVASAWARVVPDARPCDIDRSRGRQVGSTSLTRLIPALRFGLVVSVRTRGSGELLTAPRPPSPKRQAQGPVVSSCH